MTLRRAGLAALALAAVFFGANLYAATSGYVTAFDTYDRVQMRLASFDYTSPEQPVAIGFEVGNPTGQTIEITTIEVYIDVGVHRVGGGTINPRQTFAPGQTQTFAIAGDINDPGYIARNAGSRVDWGVSGRILVTLHAGVDPVWIPFAGRTVTGAT